LVIYNVALDGPELAGNAGGRLITSKGPALVWDAQGNIYIGPNANKPVAGTNDLNSILTTIQKTPGPVGPQGLVGAAGAPGIGIKTATYDSKTGNLTLAMTNNTNLGPFMIQGQQGIPGTPGISLKSAVVDKLGNLLLTMTNNTTIGPFNLTGPVGPVGPVGPAGIVDPTKPFAVNSGVPINIRDQYHGLVYSNDVDGPSLFGFGGGALGTSQQDGYKEALRWNRAGDVNVTGNFTVQGKPVDGAVTQITDYDAFTKASVSPNISKDWNIQPDNIAWDPKIRGEAAGRTGLIHTEGANAFNSDASAYFVDYDVPAGMRTAHLIHLPWSNCNYFDIWGRVGSEDEWQFITRVNAFQNTRNDQKLNYHDGATLVSIPQVNRVQGRKGRIHLMGVGWFKGIVGGASQANGFVSWESMAGSTRFKVRDEDNGITINTDGAPAGQGRMHVASEDELYVLNKKGMIVGKEWGGTGSLSVQGASSFGAGNIPADWTGVNMARRDGRWTHFDWKDDGKNHIRGDTIIDGKVTITGRTCRDASTGWNDEGGGNSVFLDR
jgi:hypothetical protein